MKTIRHTSMYGWLIVLVLLILDFLLTLDATAISRTSIKSGNWNNASCWSPSGTPAETDDVIISPNHLIIINSNCSVQNLTVSTGGKIKGLSNKSISISANLVVNGSYDMNGSDISLLNPGSAFNLGPLATFMWAPATNTSSGATLFKKGIENFNSSSTLIISKWYDYTLPLGEVVTGNFGNIVLNTPGGNNSVVEWNQKNTFEEHRIEGTLTVDCGWITLDKSGTISNTTIGKIVLNSINSTLILHNGTHPSSFSLNTSEVVNNGGKFYGINDGNGNINLIVTGDFKNSGNVKIINNSGVSGVSNGNAFVRIDGDYIQSGGDTRIIYNLSTTNSGVFTAAFRNLVLNGGIFMGQNACHTGGRLNLLNITKDFTINFNNSSDKFRGTGLTSIGQYNNNAGLAINVGRNLTISGDSLSEITSSVSAGDELINVNGDASIGGCATNFNYGTTLAGHSTELNVKGNFLINNGNICLSKNNGKLKTTFYRDIIINGGSLSIKGNSGKADITVLGKINQSGGNIFFHSNAATPSNDLIKINLKGSFYQSSGILNFDDNASGIEHTLSISGDSCMLAGDGKIIRSHSATGSGLISYDKKGTILLERKSNTHLIDGVRQEVSAGCEAIVKSGNISVASFQTTNVTGFSVMKGGKLSVQNNYSLTPNNLFSICKVFIDSSAIVSITNEKGLYGSSQSSFSTGVNYSLHAFSTIEYNGEKQMNITGNSSTAEDKKYGILKLNMITAKEKFILNENISVRTRLILVDGKIKLNNNSLTIENGSSDAIIRKNGFIESEYEISSTSSKILWKNISIGKHEFPFGRSTEVYLPVVINVVSGAGKEISASSWRLLKPNSSGSLSTNGYSTLSAALNEVNAIERWWAFSTPGVKADISFTFSSDEIPSTIESGNNILCALQWTGSEWNKIVPASKVEDSKTKTITIKNISNASDFVIVNDENEDPFELKLFEASKFDKEVLLSWETLNEPTSLSYTIEKSLDGINFFEIGTKEDNISSNNLSSYNFSDNDLPENVAYYRLKYTSNRRISYSPIKTVRLTDDYKGGPVKINSISPNPFSSTIQINYSVANERTLIEVMDMQGHIVYTGHAEVEDKENGKTMLNLEHLSKGVYFLNITSNGKRDTMKIIKNE